MKIPYIKDYTITCHEADEFDAAWEKLKPLITDPETGTFYDWFLFDHKRQSGGDVNKNGKLDFGGKVGPEQSIEGYTHELGHLMVTPEEDIGKPAWGMQTMHYGISRHGLDPILLNQNSQINGEVKAWAWEYIIECVSGMREWGDAERAHVESDWFEGLNTGDEKYKMIHDKIEAEVNRLLDLHPDIEATIRNKFSSISEIIEKNNRIKTLTRSIDNYEEISKASIERNDLLVIQLLKGSNSGIDNYIVNIMVTNPKDDYMFQFKNVYSGTNQAKAERIFRKNAEINEIPILEMQTPHLSVK